MTALYILLSVILVSFISLVGAIFLLVSRRIFQSIIFSSLAFSSGVLLATAFMDLYPTALAVLPEQSPYLLLLGILVFFIIEKLINWHHCTEGEQCPEKPLAYLSLIGDGVHNFVDGVVIAAAYLTSLPLGIATTFAVVVHEIPHELADFSLLIYSGFSTSKALFFNLLSALTAVLGSLAVLLLTTNHQQLTTYLVPFAAGNFIYIAASNLFPELRKRRDLASVIVQSSLIVLGIFLVTLVKE